MIQRLIRQKTTKYLKGSFLLFFFMTFLFITTSVSFLKQYEQMKQHFFENKSLKTIYISTKSDPLHNAPIMELQFQDREMITKKLQHAFPNISFQIYEENAINTGISANNKKRFFIRCLRSPFPDLLPIHFSDQIQAYSFQEKKPCKVVLQVPVIQVMPGGFQCNQLKKQTITIAPFPSLKTQIQKDFFGRNSNYLYVNDTTYQTIIEKMYQMPFSTFQKTYDQGMPLGIKAINQYIVYVKQLDMVEPANQILLHNGYQTNTAMSAFQDLNDSLHRSVAMFGVLFVMIALLCSVNIYIAFHMYFNQIYKDIGILKQYGYSSQKIFHIYRSVFQKPYFLACLLMMGYTAILILLLLSKERIFYYVLLSCLEFILFFCNYFLLYKQLKHTCRKNILDLLSKS